MAMVTALTVLGAANMNDSSNATSVRVLVCQHLASSKFEPSLDVRIFTSPGAYAQSTLTPRALRREFTIPVHVTPSTRATNSANARPHVAQAAPSEHTNPNQTPGTHARSNTVFVCFWHKKSQLFAVRGGMAAARAPAHAQRNSKTPGIPSRREHAANSRCHLTTPAVLRMLAIPPDCLPSMCCWRYRRRMPHIAAPQMCKAQALKTIQTNAASCCQRTGPPRVGTDTVKQPASLTRLT